MPSFDIVSETDFAEIDNAINGIKREIAQRFDFKGSKCTIEREEEAITINADDDLKLKQMHELVATHLTRRKVDPRVVDYKEPEKAAGQSVRQKAAIRKGIDQDLARQITKAIKEAKIKVQAQIQGDQVRVTGKKRDDLQAVIALMREMKADRPLQYVNFRD